jgi:hypothetical protein
MPRRPTAVLWTVALLLAVPSVAAAADLAVTTDIPTPAGALPLAGAPVLVDDHAATVVHQAAELLADDIGRVSGLRPMVISSSPRPWDKTPAAVVVIGTLGDGGAVDQLVAAGKVDATGVRGQWETFAWQLVDEPGLGIPAKALVILGSDRRGTAYGCTELSRAIGVSPWNWWADVPTPHHAQLSVSPGRHVDGPPGVKYRGIFLNDEDWGLRPWASKTFDPQLGNLGPKTYAKIFELMLRLRLNYIWPAMHPGSAEFGSVPGNAEMADHWGIVMGASHCEPMLRNNVYWNKANGPWRYDVNRDNILRYWTESVDQRGQFEADWTMGIRGIHDSPMQGPKGTEARVKMVEGIFADQQKLIDTNVTKAYGPPAECFVPYKEVLPLYDAGLKVPDAATLVWPDDNFGYIRHLPNAAERKRSGGNGVYYHVSYLGPPHAYLWVESNAPGLMWEELHKAWENDAGRLWVVNVGDLKPAELAIDFYSRLAWNPNHWGPDAQDRFLHAFLPDTFGTAAAGPLFDLESAYYRLASRRKPEHFLWQHPSKSEPEWLDGLPLATLTDLGHQYDALLALERTAAAAVPADHADAYFEIVGYAARALGLSGQLYVSESMAARGIDPQAKRDGARAAKGQIDADAARYNEQLAGGKWRGMMSITPGEMFWPKDVGGKREPGVQPKAVPADPSTTMLDAAEFTASTGTTATWRPVAGLGRSGRSVTVLPAVAFTGAGPSLTYTFDLPAAAERAAVVLHLLPTMRVDPAGHLRLSAAVDGQPPAVYAVPGGEASDENSGPRRNGVQSNRVEINLPATALAAGKHTLTVTAVDPGVVLDQVELPAGATPSH